MYATGLRERGRKTKTTYLFRQNRTVFGATQSLMSMDAEGSLVLLGWLDFIALSRRSCSRTCYIAHPFQYRAFLTVHISNDRVFTERSRQNAFPSTKSPKKHHIPSLAAPIAREAYFAKRNKILDVVEDRFHTSMNVALLGESGHG